MMLFLLGCDAIPGSVTMAGTVWDAPNGEGAALPDATIDIEDTEYALFDSATSLADGSFTVGVPAGETFFATLLADGAVPTTFSGVAGLVDFSTPSDFPWVATDAFMADIRAEFVGCPGVDDAGSAVWGEAVVDGAGYPVWSIAEVRVLAGDDTTVACYLDEDGAYDAEATTVGALGRFAVFGIEPGEIVVEVSYEDASGDQPVTLFRFLSPTDGLVPVYPALIAI